MTLVIERTNLRCYIERAIKAMVIDKKRWLIGGFITSLMPFLLIFDDSFQDGFGLFFLIGFLIVLVPLFFGLGALVGNFFDKYFTSTTSKSFYVIHLVVASILSWILLVIFYPDNIDNPELFSVLKTVFLDFYHLPLLLALLILLLSIVKLSRINRA